MNRETVEIRWHGRGGQGAKTACLLLADAAFASGKYVQGFPEYGPERMGAPITAYNRLSDVPCGIHSNIYKPDYVAVVDESLLSSVHVTDGLNPEGAIIINSPRDPEELRPLLKGYTGMVCTIDARKLSEQYLGGYFPNTPMLSAVVAVSRVLDPDRFIADMEASFHHKFATKPQVIEGNMNCLIQSMKEVRYSAGAMGENTDSKAAETAGYSERSTAKDTASSPFITAASISERSPWQEMTPGGEIYEGGTSKLTLTGEWRSDVPVWDASKCRQCLLCAPFCPDSSIPVQAGKRLDFDLNHCKGCGICAAVCPFHAIEMKPEVKA